MYVCGACFSDDGLAGYCRQYAENEECDFCGATAEEAIAAPLDEVIAYICQCVHHYFDDPANAGLAYEGEYLGETFYTSEVFEELGLDFPNDRDNRLRNVVTQGMDTDLWCQVDPYGLTPDEQLRFSWENFCQVVKHERRYFFLHEEESQEGRNYREEVHSPGATLEMILDFAKEAGALVKLGKGSRIFRARRQLREEKFRTAGELGPPPERYATQSNRMSPPGVVMTYASEDLATALAETASKPGTFAVGEFVIDRDLLILDLTKLPQAPTPFTELPDSLEYDPRPRLTFLNAVNHDISKPIARDDRVHVEYVPTQVVTEYVRTVVRLKGQCVDGIRYDSSRKRGSTALVLFANRDNLVLV
jgi:hypothetical protein